MTVELRTQVVVPELLQGEWTTLVICTFGANLTFFETRLMNQLAQVPLRIILADNDQLARTLEEAARTGQRHRLANKAYVAAPIRHPRAAHGKLMLLLAPGAGRLIVGSGNLGYDGYASPGELWHVFAYSDSDEQHLDEFAAARQIIDGLAIHQLIDPPVVELMQTAWGTATWLPPAPTGPAKVTSNMDQPIIQQLRDYAQDPVVELVVHAPFHDADCAALQELITTFAPERVRLLATAATSADPPAIARVLGGHPTRKVELVHVSQEPAAYIHAKWVHLIHESSETLLTGSANLSRAALLRASSNGNIEIGVISSGPLGTFDDLYAHLNRSEVKDISAIGIRYQGGDDQDADDEAPSLRALWSRIDGDILSITFTDVVPTTAVVLLEDHAGRSLGIVSQTISGAVVVAKLDKESAARLADGGRVVVRFGQGDEPSFTWPYQIGHLRGRLDKAGQRERLPRIGDLPDQDTELYELLRELDQTLLIDRESVWRIAKSGVKREPEADAGDSLGLADLDWARVRRDPRYCGYFSRGRAAGLPPTDIQVVLAAIGGRLGDLGIGNAGRGSEDEEDLAREGDAGIAADSEDADEELEDELSRRRMDVSTRTRLAFDRFVRRYAAALEDAAFIDELGPVPAATNAVIFDHLLARLLERQAVSPRWAIEAQIWTWRFLWGAGDQPGVTADLDEDTGTTVRGVLNEAAARATSIRGLVASLDYDAGDDAAAALRDTARHLLVDEEFGLGAELLSAAAGGAAMAPEFLSAFAQVAEPNTDGELLEYAVAPLGVARSSTEWRFEQVRRGRAIHQSATLVIRSSMDGLSIDTAHRVLERAAVAAYYAGHDASYVRVRFEGNGKSVCFWDTASESGVVMIDDDVVDLETFEPCWPEWSVRIEELEAELGVNPDSRSA